MPGDFYESKGFREMQQRKFSIPKKSFEGVPIPWDASPDVLSAYLVDIWSVWEYAEHLEGNGFAVNRIIISRPTWVKIELDWHNAESFWHHKVDAEFARNIILARAERHDLYFNHWQVKRPPGDLWEQSLSMSAREAVVFFRTEKSLTRTVLDRLDNATEAEVNSIILANSFKMMEKEGRHDAD